jgi:hypothetical protein
MSRILAVAALTTLVTATIVLGPSVVLSLREPSRHTLAVVTTSSSPIPVTHMPERLTGTFELTARVSSPLLKEYAMAGRWIVTFQPPDRVHLMRPDGGTFVTTGGAIHRTLPGTADVTGSRLTTDILAPLGMCYEYGRYRWHRRGPLLTFEPIHDPCRPRVALLSSAPWRIRRSYRG